jgi:hypothetical protein
MSKMSRLAARAGEIEDALLRQGVAPDVAHRLAVESAMADAREILAEPAPKGLPRKLTEVKRWK